MKIQKLIKSATARLRVIAAHLVANWHAHRHTPWRMRFTARSLVIGLLDSEGHSGGIYQIPRSRTLDATRTGATLRLAGQGHDPIEIQFRSAEDAAAALDRIRRRLLSNRTLVWTGRLATFGLCWLLVSSYLQVRAQQQQEAQSNEAAHGVPALPDVAAPLQEFPSLTQVQPRVVADPSPAAPADDAHGLSDFGLDLTGQAAPPSASAVAPEAANPLSGFGLALGVQAEISPVGTGAPQSPEPLIKIDPATTAAVAASAVSGPGCDPDLAFKAPVR